MNHSSLSEVLNDYAGDVVLVVRAQGEWHPVDTVTIACDEKGALVARLEAADPPRLRVVRGAS